MAGFEVVEHDAPTLYGGVSSPELDGHIGELLCSVPGGLAIMLVDLETGLQLAGKMLQPVRHADLIAAAISQWFLSAALSDIETAFNDARILSPDLTPIEEILVKSGELMHVFLRARTNRHHGWVLICRDGVGLSLALTHMRQALPKLETFV